MWVLVRIFFSSYSHNLNKQYIISMIKILYFMKENSLISIRWNYLLPLTTNFTKAKRMTHYKVILMLVEKSIASHIFQFLAIVFPNCYSFQVRDSETLVNLLRKSFRHWLTLLNLLIYTSFYSNNKSFRHWLRVKVTTFRQKASKQWHENMLSV